MLSQNVKPYKGKSAKMAETDQNTTEIEIKLYNHYIYRFIRY
ncbi:hypothetical protein NEIMUCOT_04074 [Neisseria mucosa ATCC 25996]|uniref:Uncharacterized protein n=1 Tax=Neisseria mucosa (strain ATCC 25996 / DSM 4631 / NCTC 10774 / M26) TaxID=546266 RepID=D2ZTY6_NEIM2|nr:hypothetical protein NEIMUCOT_04074 [Neisseria mucosa ATCC 25996]